MNSYLKEHPDIKNYSIVCIDGTDTINQFIINNSSAYQQVKDLNCPIYIISPLEDISKSSYNSNTTDVINLYNKGFNTKILYDGSAKTTTDVNYHSSLVINLFQNNLYQYLIGNSDENYDISNYSIYDVVGGELVSIDEIDTEQVSIDKQNEYNIMMGQLYNQHAYGNITYFRSGDGKVNTLDSGGCGFFSALSAFTARTCHKFSDEEIKYIIDEEIGGYNVSGAFLERMNATVSYLGGLYGATLEQSNNEIDTVVSALKRGNAVIVLVNGHFIALTGITEDGSIVVNDSSTMSSKRKSNYDEVGFTVEELKSYIGCGGKAWYVNFSEYYKNGLDLSDSTIWDLSQTNEEVTDINNANETSNEINTSTDTNTNNNITNDEITNKDVVDVNTKNEINNESDNNIDTNTNNNITNNKTNNSTVIDINTINETSNENNINTETDINDNITNEEMDNTPVTDVNNKNETNNESNNNISTNKNNNITNNNNTNNSTIVDINTKNETSNENNINTETDINDNITNKEMDNNSVTDVNTKNETSNESNNNINNVINEDNNITDNETTNKEVVDINNKNETNNINTGNSTQSKENNVSKIVIPGIIASALAAIGAKVGNMIKKNKDNNDI